MQGEKDLSSFKTGDLVIGSTDPGKSVYSATGSKIINDGVSIYGNPHALEEQTKEITMSAMRSGGKPMTINKTKKGGKKSVKSSATVNRNPQIMPSPFVDPFSFNQYEDSRPVEQEVLLHSVQFENDFGKIRAKVEQVIEHEQAFMLVFTDEDAVVFEPKIGETLTFHKDDRKAFEVYYPGVTFNWPVDNKKFMILFKLPSED